MPERDAIERDIEHVRERNPVENDPIEYEEAARRLADYVEHIRREHRRLREAYTRLTIIERGAGE
jgi:hypothetical protein